jgi:hypothetical protein
VIPHVYLKCILFQALELNPKDKNALVARSKCYLQLGEPHLALKDAETALHGDKNFIRGRRSRHITISETSCMNMGFSNVQLLICRFGGNHE